MRDRNSIPRALDSDSTGMAVPVRCIQFSWTDPQANVAQSTHGVENRWRSLVVDPGMTADVDTAVQRVRDAFDEAVNEA